MHMYVYIYMYIVFNIFTRRFYLKLFNFKLGLLCFFPLPPVIFFFKPTLFRNHALVPAWETKNRLPASTLRQLPSDDALIDLLRSCPILRWPYDGRRRREFGFLRVDFCTTGGYKLIGQYWTIVCFLARNDGVDFGVFFI